MFLGVLSIIFEERPPHPKFQVAALSGWAAGAILGRGGVRRRGGGFCMSPVRYCRAYCVRRGMVLKYGTAGHPDCEARHENKLRRVARARLVLARGN
jgi:hypothetical protein